MATSSSWPPRHALAMPDNTSALDGALRVLALLDDNGLLVAPTVAAHLDRCLAGDDLAILQLARWMTEGQRRGVEALPDPVPLLDAVEDAMGDGELEPWEFELLVAATVCVDDRTEVLLEFANRSIADLVGGRVSRHLRLVAGRFAFSDPRMRVWAHCSASLAQRTEVHAALSSIYARRGDEERSLWHRALCTLEGDPALVAPLMRLAKTALAAGHGEWAYAVAREATSHATDEHDAGRARLLAGVTAAAVGYLDDAAPYLSQAVAAAELRVGAEALAAHLTVSTWRLGTVPEAEFEALLARYDGGDRTVRRPLARACALAAGLSAERGELVASDRWRARLALLDDDGAASAFSRSWAVVHGGMGDRVRGDRSVLGEVADALDLGLRGQNAAAARRLAGRSHTAPTPRDTVLHGVERSPAVLAHRAVASVLVRLWGGDVAGAHDELARAATTLPVGIPFAGVGAVLARRLETAISGDAGPLSRAIAWSQPYPVRGDALLERAIVDFLADRVDEASLHSHLHHELHGPAEALWVPAVDEVGPPEAATAVGGRVPPDAVEARSVRALARGAVRAEEIAELVPRARSIDSPFERGRAEAAIGSAWAGIGEVASARRHLRVAESLLGEAGAEAWRALVERRLERLAAVPDAAVADAVRPDAAPPASTADHAHPPVEAALEPWRAVLTERELEVALLAAEGASNREIAHRLFVSVRTVEVHVGRILGKLGVRSRVELAVLAYRVGATT